MLDNIHWPRISIVTPSYNQGCYLEETIRSVLSQHYPNLEYFIIDGGSQDDSVDIIKKYDSEITYWESVPDNGQAHALNKGFSRVSGDIVGWLNSDDIYLPGALFAVALEFLNNKIDFLCGGCLLFFEGRSESDFVRRPQQRITDYLPALDYIDQPSSFWSRNIMQEIGGLNDAMHYAFDWEYFLKVYQRYPIYFSRAVFSAYRIHAKHKTGTGGERRRDEIIAIVERFATPDWLRAYKDAILLGERCGAISSRLWRLGGSSFGRKIIYWFKWPYIRRYLACHGDGKLKIIVAMLGIRTLPSV